LNFNKNWRKYTSNNADFC